MAIRRRPSGRRPGPTQTRDAILRAAVASFVTDGYLATTIRRVARAAGVDQALVLHYFGSKDELFAAALRSNAPTRLLTELYESGEVDDLGPRLVDRYLQIWEDPAVSGRLLAMLGAASMSASAARMLSAFVGEAVMHPLARALGAPDAELRANIVGSHLFGCASARYVLRVQPLASLERATVVRMLGPVIQHYLTGELDRAEIRPATADP